MLKKLWDRFNALAARTKSFWASRAVGVCGVCSLVYLKKRDPRWDDVALAAAEVAVAFGAVVLVTGSIWARAAWGVWWTWEKRLTMSLLLWLVLVGYVIVRRFGGASSERLAAGLAVFGTVGLPFIYTMVDKSEHHPQAGPQGNVATWNEGAERIKQYRAKEIIAARQMQHE